MVCLVCLVNKSLVIESLLEDRKRSAEDVNKQAQKVRETAKLEVMDHSFDFKFAPAKIQNQA